jgi:sec-independent protein translocase protein TatA
LSLQNKLLKGVLIMGSMSIVHWVIVLFVVVLLFGPRRLPELAKGVGEAVREFKKAVKDSDKAPQQLTGETKNKPTNEAHTSERA